MTEQARMHEQSCDNCGAPLSYVEGEAVITCEYCGTTNMIADSDHIVRVESHYLKPPQLDAEGAIGVAREWLKKGFHKSSKLAGKAGFGKTEGLVLPYWIVRCRAQTYWRGQKKKTRTVGTGDDKKTITEWEPVSGQFSEEYTWPIYARENREEFWGIGRLKPGAKYTFPDWGRFVLRFGGSKRSPNLNLLEGADTLDIKKVEEMKMVNGQVVQERAERHARNEIERMHADRAEKKATRITDCDTTVDISGTDLVYIPVWELEYSAAGSYRVLVDAHGKRVVAGEYPVGKWPKAVIWDVTNLLLGGVFAALAAAANMSWAWYVAGAFGVSALAYTLWTAFGGGSNG
ncbi:MAG: hypothetical protein R6U36_09000 [Candidatus Fermentibacteraceae bacterium]